MTNKDMYENIGQKPSVDIWDVAKVLSMEINKGDITKGKEAFCALESCGFSFKRLIGPFVALLGIIYLIFSVTV